MKTKEVKPKETLLQKSVTKLHDKLFKVQDALEALEDELMALYWIEKRLSKKK